MFAGTGLEVTSSRESGDGRPDVVAVDPEGRRGAVLEFKQAESEDGLESGVQEWLDQIAEFRHLEGMPSFIRQRRAYGIAFHKKRCMVRLFRRRSSVKEGVLADACMASGQIAGRPESG